MGSVFPLFLMLLLLISPSLSSETEKFTANDDRAAKPAFHFVSSRLLDLAIRDYTVKLFDKESFTTDVLNNVHLPPNFSGIEVDTARFRCGSLRRYGATIKEFQLSKHVVVNPCVERLIFIRQQLGLNYSSLYYDTHNLQGYQLVTPILGLLAYNGGDDVQNSSNPNPFELRITANEDPINVDFTNFTRLFRSKVLYCASFEGQGNVTLTSMVAPNVFHVKKQGHFGLVVESKNQSPTAHGPSEEYTKRISRWKIALGSAIGAALGAFLLGLLFVAMFAKAKKRSKLEELVTIAYQEEALQVSMVGHVRAPIAPPTRTVPIIERNYRPPRRYF